MKLYTLSPEHRVQLQQWFDQVEEKTRVARAWAELLHDGTKPAARREAHAQAYRELAGVVSRCIQLQQALGEPRQ